jgi:oligopeptidase A
MNRPARSTLLLEAVDANITQIEVLLTAEAEENHLGTFTTAYTNLTHIVAHVEANARLLEQKEALERVRSFLRSEDFCLRAYRWMSDIQFHSPRGNRIRTEWISFFQARLRIEQKGSDNDEKRFSQAVVDVLHESTVDVIGFLTRLGISYGPSGPDAALFAVASQLADYVTRRKLYQSWTIAKSQRNDEVTTAVQRLVDARFRSARATGFRTPITKSLANTTISSEAIALFLDDYLSEAITLFRGLSDMVQSVVHFPSGLAVDFPRFLRVAEISDKPLMLPLLGCFKLLTDIASRFFGLALEPATSYPAKGHVFIVNLDQIPVGIIIFHSTDTNVESPSHLRLPVAYVFCRLTQNDRRHMTFNAARLLFHEFGHALIHILSYDRKPGISGLDYLPVERLEFLSTWFENWVYHQAMEEIVLPSDGAFAALNRARRIKAFEFMKSNLGRAVCAVVDFRIHSDPSASLGTVIRQLRQRHSEIDQIVESEVLADFAHPLLLAHPGCSFIYPAASSYASKKFLPLMDRAISKIGADLCDLTLSTASDGPCPTPDPTAPRAFFEKVLYSR